MTNTIELRVEMLRHGDKDKDLANYLGITKASMSHKINNHTPWLADEVQKVAIKYALEPKRVCEIFFADMVS